MLPYVVMKPILMFSRFFAHLIARSLHVSYVRFFSDCFYLCDSHDDTFVDLGIACWTSQLSTDESNRKVMSTDDFADFLAN